MKRTLVVLLVLGALIVLVALGTCIVGVGAMAPRILGAGPDGIDLRPTLGAVSPEAALPPEVAGYERGECRPISEFRGVDLGSSVVETVYTGPGGSVHVVAAWLGSYHAAATAVSELAAQLEKVGSLDSRRLVAEEPFEGWWSASGKRNFVFWHAPTWGADRHGFAWQSGCWCFIVASNDPVARRDVTVEFPY